MARKNPSAPRAVRRRARPEPASRGLSPADCAGPDPAAVAPLVERIRADGGTVLAAYRDPLGGRPLVLAALPLEKVAPTPFQRDLSEAHARRLTETIGKLGSFLDPVIAVAAPEGGYLTPNGRHRLEALSRLGARAVTALVVPDADLQYRILALNVEKAHNLREKALEVVRLYRARAAAGAPGAEADYALEFEEPFLATLGICYERNGRFSGGAYQPLLKRVDRWIEQPLAEALQGRERRAAQVARLDDRVGEIVGALQARGLKSPYLKAFVMARLDPFRFGKSAPGFEAALEEILRRADKFDPAAVRPQDLSAAAGPPPEAEG
jgi:ParB family chromosome partitioning protein